MPMKNLTVSEDNSHLGASVRGGWQTYQPLRVTPQINLATKRKGKYQIKDKSEK